MQNSSSRGFGGATTRPRRWGTVRGLAALTLLTATGLVASHDVGAVHDAGALELDVGADGANLVDDSGPGDPLDWATVFTYDEVADMTSPSGTQPAGYIDSGFSRDFTPGASGPDNSYFKPSTKDDQSVNATGKASEVWGCTTAANPTDKNDILNAYSLAVVAQDGEDIGDTILYTGGERFANDGTAFWGVWYFQEDVGCDASGGTTTFTGKKTDGDVLLLINFDNGGTNVTIDAFNWHPCDADGSPIAAQQCKVPADNAGYFTPALDGAVGGDCQASLDGDDVCATVNRATVTTPWPTQDKTSAANTLAISEFFESGFNLTDAFKVPPGQEPCFSSFLLETRSSSSIDATLKDFAGGSLETCGDLTVHKYHDQNANKIDDGEPGLAGWTMFIDEDDDEFLDDGEASATTDANGDAVFQNIKAGTISVCEVLTAGWINSDPGAGTPADPDGTTLCKDVVIQVSGDSSVSLGNYQPADVSGTKFQDDNEDGDQDSGESGIAGVWIHLFGTDSYGQSVHEHTQTDSNGDYGFTGLQPGSYTLCETIPDGYKQTAPSSGPDCSTHDGHLDPPGDAGGYGISVTLGSQDNNLDNDFGNAPLLGAIKIVKTRKHAADGPGDHPHADVSFTVKDADDNIVAMVMTNSSGIACVDGLVISQFAGNYSVTETVPLGYVADGATTKSATVVESTCDDGNAVVVTFANTPLTNIDVFVDSQVDGGTASTISCVNTLGDADPANDVVVGEDLTNAPGDVSLENVDDLLPGTYVCTIVIDP